MEFSFYTPKGVTQRSWSVTAIDPAGDTKTSKNSQELFTFRKSVHGNGNVSGNNSSIRKLDFTKDEDIARDVEEYLHSKVEEIYESINESSSPSEFKNHWSKTEDLSTDNITTIDSITAKWIDNILN